jgi:iron complex transport system ATP-binding protein
MDGGLRSRHLWLGYGPTPAVRDVNLDIKPGAMVALIGPNGSGKSTLLKGLARLLPARHGTVLLDGHVIHTLPSREVARCLAILPQGPESPADLTVRELVALGRWPHRRLWHLFGVPYDAAVEWAMAVTSVTPLARRPLATLSGGERQRVWIAMALAQTPDVLLLDEPTTHLDVGHQWEVMELLEGLNRRQGVTILMALHDLQHAAWFSQWLVVVQEGRMVAQGPPGAVLTAELIATVFGMRARVCREEEIGRVLCILLGRLQQPEVAAESSG